MAEGPGGLLPTCRAVASMGSAQLRLFLSPRAQRIHPKPLNVLFQSPAQSLALPFGCLPLPEPGEHPPSAKASPKPSGSPGQALPSIKTSPNRGRLSRGSLPSSTPRAQHPPCTASSPPSAPAATLIDVPLLKINIKKNQTERSCEEFSALIKKTSLGFIESLSRLQGDWQPRGSGALQGSLGAAGLAGIPAQRG